MAMLSPPVSDSEFADEGPSVETKVVDPSVETKVVDPSVETKVEEAMDLAYSAVRRRLLGPVTRAMLSEWIKRMRDELRSAEMEARTERKRQRNEQKAHKRPKRSKLERDEAKVVLREMQAFRARAKAERKIETAVSHLWRLSGGPRPPVPIHADLSAADELATSLDAQLCSRSVPGLVADDCLTVEQLGQLIAVSSTFNEGLDRSLHVDEVPGVMTRCTLFEGTALTVRLHMFPAMAETYIHNHKNSFASMCLYGCYTHTTWQVTEVPGAKHYEFVRDGVGNLSPPTEREGELSVANSFQHEMNKVYYLSRDAFHTVSENSGGSLLPGTLTLYIKGKDEDVGFQTRVLSQSPEFEEAASEPERTLEGEEKIAVLRNMAAMLRLSAADQLKTGY